MLLVWPLFACFLIYLSDEEFVEVTDLLLKLLVLLLYSLHAEKVKLLNKSFKHPC